MTSLNPIRMKRDEPAPAKADRHRLLGSIDRHISRPKPEIHAASGSGCVEAELEIASPEAVWKALREASELRLWFPIHATVTPGPGGVVWQSWTESGGSLLDIEIWDPARHLGTRGRLGEWRGLSTDYHLEARAGRTVLRVVSSGFSADEDRNRLLGAFGLGWSFELEGLKHYLERHPGADRVAAVASRRYRASADDVWRAIVGPGGWLGLDGKATLAPHRPWSALTGAANRISGSIRSVARPKRLE